MDDSGQLVPSKLVEPESDDIREHGPVVVVTAIDLKPAAREALAHLLGPGHIVIDIREADNTADIVLVPPASPQLIGAIRRLFPDAKLLITELTDPVHGIDVQGPVRRSLDSGVDGYFIAPTLDELASITQRAALGSGPRAELTGAPDRHRTGLPSGREISARLADHPAQRKVAVFVVRNASTTAEVAVFWHPGGGLQVPAGTVEPGESFEQAAIREAIEETGLHDVVLVRDLGSQELIMSAGRALLLEEVNLRLSPEGPQTRWRLSRSAVEVIELRGDWAMVRMQERDLDNPEFVVADLTGWVPVNILTRRQERRFYLASSNDTKIDSWQHQGEPEHLFTLSWQPVRPRPKLIAGQDVWLDRLDAALRAGR